MNTTDIIQTLGGTFAVAKMCGVTPPAVSQWKQNGLPGDKLILLASELEKKSDGKWTRKEISNWQQIWPELKR
jgi:DNA-binding transcriptional regulator YdaS (Cro superfamily)